jgi:Cu2+-exporting ATPase
MRREANGESRTFCCYGCSIAYQVKNGSSEEWNATWLLVRLGVGGFLSMNIMLFSLLLYADAFAGAEADRLPAIQLLLWILATPTLAILGGPFMREAWAHAVRGRLESSALIVLGVGAAYTYSAYAVVECNTHIYFDTATMVLMLFTLGRYLEAAGRARAVRNLEPLLAAEGAWATVIEGETQARRPVREVTAGMRVRVLPGERIPIDGVIIAGASHVDEAVITGESRQIAKGEDSAVIAGSIALDGPLLIQSSGAGNATRWAQICRSVGDALSRQSPTQRVADRVVGVFVPIVLCIGGATVLYWARQAPFDQALLLGLAVLVVACPCAVGLAAPLATSVGIGRLARSGCLVRDPASLEILARTRFLAFDKTGTLTSGRPHLAGIALDGVGTERVLAFAAGLERHSEHGFARSITEATAARGVPPLAVQDVRVVPGRGVVGGVDGQAVAAGSKALMGALGWPISRVLADRARLLEECGHSMVYVGWGDRVRAALALDDTPLPEARSTIERLHRLGLHITLLTGDLAQAAQRIADDVGIDEIEAGLSPEAKLAALDRRRRSGDFMAMVGDGLNDGPVLADADVGIAVGSATDLARETANIVLPAGGIWMLPWVVGVARAVRITVLTNLMWAFGYNLIALTLAASGLLQPIFAAAIMAGSSLLVVANSMRLQRLPGPDSAAVPMQPSTTEAETTASRRVATVSAAADPVREGDLASKRAARSSSSQACQQDALIGAPEDPWPKISSQRPALPAGAVVRR